MKRKKFKETFNDFNIQKPKVYRVEISFFIIKKKPLP